MLIIFCLNIQSESEVTFEYGVRENLEEGLKSLPFQMQVCSLSFSLPLFFFVLLYFILNL